MNIHKKSFGWDPFYTRLAQQLINFINKRHKVPELQMFTEESVAELIFKISCNYFIFDRWITPFAPVLLSCFSSGTFVAVILPIFPVEVIRIVHNFKLRTTRTNKR